MRIASVFLSVLLLGAAPPDGAQPAALKFEEVVLVEGRPPNVSLLYVVLTVPRANNRKLDELVVKYARAALREAAAHQFKGATRAGVKPKHDGNIVFLVREARGDRRGAITGFGVRQRLMNFCVGPYAPAPMKSLPGSQRPLVVSMSSQW